MEKDTNDNPLCYVCGNNLLLPENITEEHIILESIGGRLKAYKIICKECNIKFGTSFDNILSEQLQFITGQLVVNRERKKNANIKGIKAEDGKTYDLIEGYIPSLNKLDFSKKTDGNKTTFSYRFRSQKEYEEQLSKLKEKYPSLVVEKEERVKRYVTSPLVVDLNLGGPEAFRSICKTALSYYLFKGGKQEYIKHLVPYLEGKEEQNAVIIYATDNIKLTRPDEIFHSILLKGNSKEKILVAYVELFSCFSFMVLLNDSYNGENISLNYFFDVLNTEIIERDYNLNFSASQIKEIFKTGSLYYNDLLNIRLTKIMEISGKRQRSKILKTIIAEVCNDYLKQNPGITVFTEELLRNLVSEIAPFIAHNYFQTEE